MDEQYSRKANSHDHVKKLIPLLSETIKESNINADALDGIAYTAGPGLRGPLLTGAALAQSLGDVWISNNKIKSVGTELNYPADIRLIDATGKWLTPGIIDIHSHMGVYSAPGVKTSSDGNESTSPVTADVWAEHSMWVQDPQYALAL